MHAALVKNTPLSIAVFSNVLAPLAAAENALLTESRILVFYKSVSTDVSVREASAKAKDLFDAFRIETAMNEPLFKLVDTVLQGNNQDLDAESLRFLQKWHSDHTGNGLSLPGPERERFKAIKIRLSELESEFLKNLAKAKSGCEGIWFTREQLDGLPETVFDRLKRGQDENSGRFQVTYSNADFFSVLRFAKDAATRKQIFIAVENMCRSSIPIFKEAVILRDEAAKLLGYPNHAAFSTKEKMVQAHEAVDRFLSRLKYGLVKVASEEVKRLKQLKQEYVEARHEPFDGRFFIWDHQFYNNLALQRNHDIDQQKIAEYFPINTVVSNMLDIFEKLIGFRFLEIRADIKSRNVWHEDVQVFSVWNSDDLGGAFVGYLYLDLFPREGKPGHACSFNLVPVSPHVSRDQISS